MFVVFETKTFRKLFNIFCSFWFCCRTNHHNTPSPSTFCILLEYLFQKINSIICSLCFHKIRSISRIATTTEITSLKTIHIQYLLIKSNRLFTRKLSSKIKECPSVRCKNRIELKHRIYLSSFQADTESLALTSNQFCPFNN